MKNTVKSDIIKIQLNSKHRTKNKPKNQRHRNIKTKEKTQNEKT